LPCMLYSYPSVWCPTLHEAKAAHDMYVQLYVALDVVVRPFRVVLYCTRLKPRTTFLFPLPWML